MGEILDSLEKSHEMNKSPEQKAADAAAAQQQAEYEAAHRAAANSFINQGGSNLGSYGFTGSAGYDPYQPSQLRPDQTNAERIDQQVGNFMYGGYAGGAADAQAAARGAVYAPSTTMGIMGDQLYGQAGIGAGMYGAGSVGMFGTAGALNQYAQQGPGPSVAQAQLQANTAQAMRQQLALAGSGRGAGGGAAAFRQAAGNQAQIAGQANAQAAMLQAQEAQNWRQAQLAAMQGAGGLYGQAAGMGADYATSMGGLGLQGQQGAGELALGGEQLAHQIGGVALSGSQAYEGNLTDIYGINKGIGAQPSNEMTTKDWIGMGLQAGATVAAAASDERVKTNVESADGEGLEMLSHLSSNFYDYKQPEKHGEGRYYGPMAQELERSKAGKSAVREVGGVKMVDTGRLSLNLAGAMGEMYRRLVELEGRA